MTDRARAPQPRLVDRAASLFREVQDRLRSNVAAKIFETVRRTETSLPNIGDYAEPAPTPTAEDSSVDQFDQADPFTQAEAAPLQAVEKFVAAAFEPLSKKEKADLLRLLQNEALAAGENGMRAINVIRETVLWTHRVDRLITETQQFGEAKQTGMTSMYELVGLLLERPDHTVSVSPTNTDACILIQQLRLYVESSLTEFPSLNGKNFDDILGETIEDNRDGAMVQLRLKNPEQDSSIMRELVQIWRYAAESAQQEPALRTLLSLRTLFEGVYSSSKKVDSATLYSLLALVKQNEKIMPKTPPDQQRSESILSLKLQTYVYQLKSTESGKVADLQKSIQQTSDLLAVSNKSLAAQVIKLIWRSCDPQHEVFSEAGTFPGSIKNEVQSLAKYHQLTGGILQTWEKIN